jgi:hypothetical protein
MTMTLMADARVRVSMNALSGGFPTGASFVDRTARDRRMVGSEFRVSCHSRSEFLKLWDLFLSPFWFPYHYIHTTPHDRNHPPMRY